MAQTTDAMIRPRAADEDRGYVGSRFSDVVGAPTWRGVRNDPATATRIAGRKVR